MTDALKGALGGAVKGTMKWSALLLGTVLSQAAAYTYPELVARMKDLERLALLPEIVEKVVVFSSQDRAATYNPVTDVYANWGANGDCCATLRKNEDGGWVLAEMSGPGCFWRLNGATKNTAHVKIFLDGAAAPAVDMAWGDYFNASQAPFNHPSLSYVVAGGMSFNYPIPFQTSLKVVAYDDWNSYYYVEATAFPKGTEVPAFSRNLGAADKAALDNLDRYFSQGLGADPADHRSGQVTDSSLHTVGAGQASLLLDASGPGAITGIRMRIDGLATKAEGWAAMRELAISIAWDGESKPSVWAPVGDFFGTPCGLDPYRSLPTGAGEDGWMYAYWYMPFAGARMVIRNDGSKPRTFAAAITHAPLTRPIADFARFHAKWNRNAFQSPRKDRWPDYTVLKTTGRGRFLGFGLHLYKPNDSVDPKSSPGDYWWGEGDEKFYVDGEKYPSWFGTGSEDYFAFAWATPDLFGKPYHSQVYNEGGIHWQGNRAMNRFQIVDAVPFQSGFEATLEKYYSDEYARYGAMPRWYLAPGGEDPYGEASLAERTDYYAAAPAGDTTRIEGEDLRVVSKTGGSPVPQHMEWAGAGKWSNGQHLFWFKNNLDNVEANGKAVLELPIARTADYRVRAVFTQAFDYGTVRLGIDGVACGEAVDLYHDGPTTTVEKEFCARTLSAGTHALSLTITGKNAAAQAYYVGLDYLKLIGSPTSVLPSKSALISPALKSLPKPRFNAQGARIPAGAPRSILPFSPIP